jgi:pilus assembly protein TadC
MFDLLLFITSVFIAFSIVLYIRLVRVQKEIEKIHEWADTVDEFMDAEYIEIQLEEKK